MANLTLLDIAKRSGNDAVTGLIEEVLTSAPEARIFPMRTISGTSYQTLKRTGLPTTGFRTANAGIAASKSTYTNELVQTYLFGGTITCDVAVANAAEDGPDAVKADEASGVMKSALIELGKQIWYGVSEDSLGFPGLKAFTAAGSTYTLDATGTTGSTASSVYAVKFGNQGVQLVAGRGNAFSLGDWFEQLVLDGNNLPYRAYCNTLEGWIGMATASSYCVGRIYNLTADSGKGLTDALLNTLEAKFPVGVVPDAYFMSRRSRSQLQNSRTATAVYAMGMRRQSDGTDIVAPLPTASASGIPIYATDSILNTDAIGS